jgi:hypothetical protein
MLSTPDKVRVPAGDNKVGPRAANARDRYAQLALKREPFLVRARGFAALTIPSLQPPVGMNYSQHLPQNYCGLSSRVVLHLSSKMMAALMPAGSKIFRQQASSKALAANKQTSLNAEQERILALLEDIVHEAIEQANWREVLYLTEQHLIATGNFMVHLMPDNRLRGFRLDQYVCHRDANGDLDEFITAEIVQGDMLDEMEPFIASDDLGTNAPRLYTWGRRSKDGKWTVHQEVEGHMVPGSEGTYSKGTLPFFALRWAWLVGEHYGRSKVEEHEADFRYAEHLTKCVGDGAAIAARAIVMVKPSAGGGLNLRRRLRDAQSGDVVIGNPDDVDFKSFTNVAGFQFAAAELAQVKKELASAFLLNSSVQRDAERVTAFELRQMIEELEGTLGGVFTLQSNELMRPLVVRLLYQMTAAKELPELGGAVTPTLLVGLAALGRETDFQKVGEVLQLMQSAPQEAATFLNWTELLERALIGIGFANCVYTQEQVAQIKQQQALIAGLQNIHAPVAQAAAQGMMGGAPQQQGQ